MLIKDEGDNSKVSGVEDRCGEDPKDLKFGSKWIWTDSGFGVQMNVMHRFFLEASTASLVHENSSYLVTQVININKILKNSGVNFKVAKYCRKFAFKLVECHIIPHLIQRRLHRLV